MEIRGIAFDAEQTTVCLLKSIVEPLLLSEFYWYHHENQEEVWSRPEGRPFFSKSIYTSDELSRLVCSDHFVVFLRLDAYPQIENISDFTTYSEYSNSNCQIVILIYDCEQIRIYIKDAKVATRVFSYYQKKFKNVRYITDANDTRRSMNIM